MLSLCAHKIFDIVEGHRVLFQKVVILQKKFCYLTKELKPSNNQNLQILIIQLKI